mmetsp:Transcript_24108/g.48819  ORF Transcript_24108/g.48819 Transcript_24108/m.48819 type:complete len:143 (+) Transcript_24108:205-633(+)
MEMGGYTNREENQGCLFTLCFLSYFTLDSNEVHSLVCIEEEPTIFEKCVISVCPYSLQVQSFFLQLPAGSTSPLRTHQAFPCVNTRLRVCSLYIVPVTHQWQSFQRDLGISEITIFKSIHVQKALSKVGTTSINVQQGRPIH